jgi:hypothetical protein
LAGNIGTTYFHDTVPANHNGWFAMSATSIASLDEVCTLLPDFTNKTGRPDQIAAVLECSPHRDREDAKLSPEKREMLRVLGAIQ